MRFNKRKTQKTIGRHAQHRMNPSMKRLLCQMVLLHAPRSHIAAVLRACQLHSRAHEVKSWSKDELKAIAETTLTKRPQMIAQADDMNHKNTIETKRWLNECKLAIWIVEQNHKGISVPSRLAVDTYLKEWGMGPHSHRLACHLHKFDHHKKWKKWVFYFRQRWGFAHAVCPKGPPLTAHQIEEKVSLHSQQKTQHKNKQKLYKNAATCTGMGSRIGNPIGFQNSGPILETHIILFYAV